MTWANWIRLHVTWADSLTLIRGRTKKRWLLRKFLYFSRPLFSNIWKDTCNNWFLPSHTDIWALLSSSQHVDSNSAEWEPPQITRKYPDYWQFLHENDCFNGDCWTISFLMNFKKIQLNSSFLKMSVPAYFINPHIHFLCWLIVIWSVFQVEHPYSCYSHLCMFSWLFHLAIWLKLVKGFEGHVVYNKQTIQMSFIFNKVKQG